MSDSKTKLSRVTYSSEDGESLTIQKVWQLLREEVILAKEGNTLGPTCLENALELEDEVFLRFHASFKANDSKDVPTDHVIYLTDRVPALYNDLLDDDVTTKAVKKAAKKQKKPKPRPTPQVPVQHYAHWVGGKFHSRGSFIKEARQLGVSIRIGRVPVDLVLGKTRVYLVGDLSEKQRKKYLAEQRRKKRARRTARQEGKTVSFKGSEIQRGKARVFAYFVVRGVAYIVQKGVDIPEELRKRGVTKWEYEEGGFGFCDERACGSLKLGGLYLLSEEDMQKVKDLADATDLEAPGLILLKPPFKWDGGRFRGLKKYTPPSEVEEK